MFRSRFLKCAGREVHFTEWGRTDSPALVMWHGLTRNGRDFDESAAALCGKWRVICPDTPGRGLSQWLNPNEYRLEIYARIAAELLDKLNLRECQWIGTSMGGLLGMRLAAVELREKIRALVLNDVGPTIPAAAMARIAAYAGKPPVFDAVSEFSAWQRQAYKSFGENPESFWERLAASSCRRLPDGRITAHYDPAIVSPFAQTTGGLDMWKEYDSIQCPVLLLRGESSDVLPAETAKEMTRRGPRAKLLTFPNCGHVPTLTTPEQIAPVRAFLTGRKKSPAA